MLTRKEHDWAVDYILTPLYGPTPSEMDGPGTHFYAESTNPFRNRINSGLSLERCRSNSSPPSAIEKSRTDFRDGLKQEQYQKKKSHRSHRHHHSSRKTRVNPDIIDRLDDVSTVSYHHEGPYDAIYPERNTVSHRSPLDAVKDSNEETLRATPYYKIMDSIHRHRPLDGVAYYPPGTTDEEGQIYDYAEGDNMMTEAHGNFQRAPGTKFTEEDFQDDPFYQQDNQRPPRRMGSLRKALGTFKGRSRKNTA